MPSEALTLFDFSQPDDAPDFQAIDDRVMGGISKSAVTLSPDGYATFSGIVSLEQNGGFASVRAPLLKELDASNYSGLCLRVCGDGKVYKLRLCNTSTADSIVYEASFATKAEHWLEIDIPFKSLIPKWRGRTLHDAPAFDASSIRSLGFLISDSQVGAFLLNIDWIRLQP